MIRAENARDGPHAPTSRPSETPDPPGREALASRLAGAADSGRACEAPGCGQTLPSGRRRFCSDRCCRRGRRAERITEDADYTAGVRRLVAAQGKRAGADLTAFVMFAEAVDFARARLQDAADQILAHGYSYADVGAALGITRQGAWKRFGRQPKVGSGRQVTRHD